jgi:hypothetical protein
MSNAQASIGATGLATGTDTATAATGTAAASGTAAIPFNASRLVSIPDSIRVGNRYQKHRSFFDPFDLRVPLSNERLDACRSIKHWPLRTADVVDHFDEIIINAHIEEPVFGCDICTHQLHLLGQDLIS